MISDCQREDGHYRCHLADVERIERPRKPKATQPTFRFSAHYENFGLSNTSCAMSA